MRCMDNDTSRQVLPTVKGRDVLCTGDWVDPRAGMERCGKISPPPFRAVFNPRTVRTTASHYIDWVISGTQWSVLYKTFVVLLKWRDIWGLFLFSLKKTSNTKGEKVKVKVKSILVPALRLCTGRTVHRGSRGIAILYRHWGSVQAVRPIGGVEV